MFWNSRGVIKTLQRENAALIAELNKKRGQIDQLQRKCENLSLLETEWMKRVKDLTAELGVKTVLLTERTQLLFETQEKLFRLSRKAFDPESEEDGREDGC